jgi:hypothetical protein
MHNGLHSAGSIYAYVQCVRLVPHSLSRPSLTPSHPNDPWHDGKWWRVADGLSTEVTFASVKSDQSGLHLGAGPFALLYERGRGWVGGGGADGGEEEDGVGGLLGSSAPVTTAAVAEDQVRPPCLSESLRSPEGRFFPADGRACCTCVIACSQWTKTAFHCRRRRA